MHTVAHIAVARQAQGSVSGAHGVYGGIGPFAPHKGCLLYTSFLGTVTELTAHIGSRYLVCVRTAQGEERFEADDVGEAPVSYTHLGPKMRFAVIRRRKKI